MADLAYTLTNDILFKSVFTQHQDLLKSLVAALLSIEQNTIDNFKVTNPEIPPDTIEEKFCRLDINMIVNDQRIDLELQVANEGDYPERSLYYWAREFSSSLHEGEKYLTLPKTIIISILSFKLFKCSEYHSEFQALETTRYEQLTNKMSLHYFELPKLSDTLEPTNQQSCWLQLIKAKTEEELERLKKLGVPIMEQVIEACQTISNTSEFKERERLRSLARHNEAAAVYNAEQRGEQRAEKRLQDVIAKKDALIEELKAQLDKRNGQ